MEYLISTAASSFEYLSIIVLMFTVYNLSFKKLYLFTLFICLFLASLSNFLEHIGIAEGILNPIIQILSFIALVWGVYRISMFWSVVVALTGYVGYGVIQFSIFTVLHTTGYMSSAELIPNTTKFYVLQIFSILIPLIISHALYSFRWQLNFIPTYKHLKIKIKGENLIIFTVSILTFISSFITFYWIKEGQASIFCSMLVIQFITVYYLLHYSIKKEVKNDY